MKPIAAVLFCLCSIVGLAQKNDYTWISGYGSYYSNADSIARGWKFGHSIFDFNPSPVDISYDSLGMDIDATNTSISNNDGNLLFYTNGVWVANNQHRKIYNSDSLNEGWLMTSFDPTIRTWGYRLAQGIIALPDINNGKQYRIIHSLVDSLPGSNQTNVNTPKILSTHLDMEANFLAGEVLSKNVSILEGNLAGELTAVRHGNGRDWWLPIQKRGTPCFDGILYDRDGFHAVSNIGCGQTAFTNEELGAASFSPDGTKYAYGGTFSGVDLFSFDRCRGVLGNVIHIPVSSYVGGISFSPNNRFMYVSAATIMLQFDTWATDIAASVDTIGVYDGYTLNQSFISGLFKTSQLAPDGKIYINCGSTIDVYHCINNPDEKGAACNFAQHSIKISLSHNIPNYPNYRLGALPGSACDTLTSVKDIAEKEKILKVFPNPANDVATIDYGYTDWSKGETSMEITNSLGQTVHSQNLPMYSGFQKLQVANYPSGSYTVYIKRKGNIVAAGRLVKE